MAKLTHIDEQGSVQMVDVTDKDVTDREAMASGKIEMQPETLHLITQGKVSKGNVLETARIAGIMAAKRTSDLIPMCHPLGITGVELSFEIDKMEHYSACDCARTRPHRCRNGSPDRRKRGPIDHLRHVQSSRSRHGHRRNLSLAKKRWTQRNLCSRRPMLTMRLDIAQRLLYIPNRAKKKRAYSSTGRATDS